MSHWSISASKPWDQCNLTIIRKVIIEAKTMFTGQRDEKEPEKETVKDQALG